ncbi:MAG: hypothetical protein JWO38_920 [Gemmataceae bacterium]|nr:hypothetical protein [Gemmataceae bacterium]
MIRLASVMAVLMSVSTAAGHDIDYTRYVKSPEEVAKEEQDRQEALKKVEAKAAERRAILKAACWWLEGLAKVLFFLSFWYVSSEVIKLPRWNRIQDRASYGVAAIVFFGIMVATDRGWDQAAIERNRAQREMLANISLPGYHPPPPNPVQNAIRNGIWAIQDYSSATGSSASIFAMGFVAGILSGILTRKILTGWKDHLSEEWRLTIGAIAFGIGGVLDVGTWYFKPE